MNKQPIYKQVKESIKNKIDKDNLKIGDKIPTERELSNQFNVSRYSIRKAIVELEQEGYLKRIQGKGTFLKQNLEQYGQVSKHIGIIMAHYEEDFQLRIIRGIGKRLQQNNYKMTLVDTDYSFQKEIEYINQLKMTDVDGLIILPTDNRQHNNEISSLIAEQYPFVLIDRELEDCEADCVLSKNIDGAYQATKYLLRLGHKRIGFVKERFMVSSVKNRLIGYKKALIESGLGYNLDMVYTFDNSLSKEESYLNLVNFIYELGITAIVSINDLVALDIIKMCRQQDINIPEDLSILGFANVEFTKHLETPLTTVEQFPEEIGYCAADLLLNKILNTDHEEWLQESKMTRQIYYPVKLIIRDSCKKIN